MSATLSPPLRSALKNSSRPSSPAPTTSGSASSSPVISRVSLPSSSSLSSGFGGSGSASGVTSPQGPFSTSPSPMSGSTSLDAASPTTATTATATATPTPTQSKFFSLPSLPSPHGTLSRSHSSSSVAPTHASSLYHSTSSQPNSLSQSTSSTRSSPYPHSQSPYHAHSSPNPAPHSNPHSDPHSNSHAHPSHPTHPLPLPSALFDGTHHHPPNPLASPHYTPKVSFDTFSNPVASMFSYTLQVKSEGYRRTRNTRVFLCASSPDESGREALDWCLEALVQDGDELIVFRGVEQDALGKDHNTLRTEARLLLHTIQSKSTAIAPTRKLSLILEYIPGKVTDSLDRLTALYRPDSLVVGTRGRRFGVGIVQGLGAVGAGLVQGLGVGGGYLGSVSKYCLSHSPVPVIVVRPGRKLRKAVEKRRADPKRGRHFE